MEIFAWSGGGVLVLAFLVSCRMQVEQRRRIAGLGDRLAHLTAGMSLLTDTVEGGLRDVAQEIQRTAVAPPPVKPKRAATQRRVAGASRRGRSVQHIAATEKMSEGEVRLRLHLSGAGRENERAAVR